MAIEAPPPGSDKINPAPLPGTGCDKSRLQWRTFGKDSLNIVNLDRLVLKVFVEPVNDVLQAFDAMPGRT